MLTILVIDDVDEARATIIKILKKNGYDTLEANNGQKGLQIIRQHAPDLVITDILMPEMEGLETIKQIKKIDPNLPVIAITASMDTPYLQIALQFGAVDGLYKPFRHEELISAVKKALKTD